MNLDRFELPEAGYRTIFEAAYDLGARALQNCKIFLDVIRGNTTNDGWTDGELDRYWAEHSGLDPSNSVEPLQR